MSLENPQPHAEADKERKEVNPFLVDFLKELGEAEKNALSYRDYAAQSLRSYLAHPKQLLNDAMLRSPDGRIFSNRGRFHEDFKAESKPGQGRQGHWDGWEKKADHWEHINKIPEEARSARWDGTDEWAWETADEYNSRNEAVQWDMDLEMTEKEIERMNEESVEKWREMLTEAQKAVDELKVLSDRAGEIPAWAAERAENSDRYDKEVNTKDWIALKEFLSLPAELVFNREHIMREKLAEMIDRLAGIKDIKRGNYYS